MLRTTATALVWMGACALCVSAASSTSSYTFTTIDNPYAAAGEHTRAFGINDAGDIVGDFGPHGFLYQDDVFYTIDVPGAEVTQPIGINNAGQIVGFFLNSSGAHAFVLSRAVFTTLDVPGAGFGGLGATRAHGINAAGQIIGEFDSLTGTHGFLYDEGTFTILDFPGAYATQAHGINDAGDIVGAAAFAGIGGSSGFIYRKGTFTRLNNPAASSVGGLVTAPTGINSRGQVVGHFTDQSVYRAFIYNAGVFTTMELPPGAANESFAVGINNAGHIVGYFNSATGNHGFLAIRVPGR